jgi:hypothetical protein
VLGPSLFALGLAAAAPAADPPSIPALRVREDVHVDGVLDEPAWSRAGVASGLRQMEPIEGAPATEATEVRVLYDDLTLYIGIRALDREPQKVIARVLQRDKILQAGADNIVRWTGDDGIAVLLDPFHDHRNAFVFATNPNGAEYEALVTDESPLYNSDWRAVWRVAARRASDGWVAEIAIPFRSLRYPAGDGGQPWGFNVERFVRRTSEQSLWTGWSRAEGGLNRVSRAGHLVGLSGLPRPHLNLEVKPYGLLGATRKRQDDGSTPRETTASVGGDLKWEVASGLVLDGTVNPDFAQVEADDQIVNLTRFDVFLPEKREFFLENAGVFEFGTRGLFEPPPFLLFFSRQIGIKEDEGEVPVMGGVRLSGRVGRQTVGFLSILQDAAFGDPRTVFTAVRVKRDVGASGFLGGMLTDRRTGDGGETDGGVDFSLWPTRRLNLTGFAALTSTTAERRSDAAWRVGAEYRSSHLYLNGEQLVVGPDAETGMGFVTRTDIRRSDGFASLTLRPHRLGVRDVELFGGGDWITRTSGEPQDGYGFGGLGLRLDSGDLVSAMAIGGFTQLDEAFDLADRIPVPVGRYDFRQIQAGIESSPSRPVSVSVMGGLADQWDGRVDSLQTAMRVALGPHFEAGPTWTVSRADLPDGGFTAHVVGLRFGWAFSTRLFARAYVQYNSLDDKWITNVRLNFIHRPGSDIYVVLNDDEGEEGAPCRLVSRGFAVKGTWLIRF